MPSLNHNSRVRITPSRSKTCQKSDTFSTSWATNTHRFENDKQETSADRATVEKRGGACRGLLVDYRCSKSQYIVLICRNVSMTWHYLLQVDNLLTWIAKWIHFITDFWLFHKKYERIIPDKTLRRPRWCLLEEHTCLTVESPYTQIHSANLKESVCFLKKKKSDQLKAIINQIKQRWCGSD